MSRIRKVVEGVHMGLGHDGIAELLKSAKPPIDLTQLAPGDLVMCLNSKGDKMKVIGHRGLVIGYLKMPHGHRIMKDALQFIPLTFGSNGFDYDKAVEKALNKRLANYPVRRHINPIQEAKELRA